MSSYFHCTTDASQIVVRPPSASAVAPSALHPCFLRVAGHRCDVCRLICLDLSRPPSPSPSPCPTSAPTLPATAAAAARVQVPSCCVCVCVFFSPRVRHMYATSWHRGLCYKYFTVMEDFRLSIPLTKINLNRYAAARENVAATASSCRLPVPLPLSLPLPLPLAPSSLCRPFPSCCTQLFLCCLFVPLLIN